MHLEAQKTVPLLIFPIFLQILEVLFIGEDLLTTNTSSTEGNTSGLNFQNEQSHHINHSQPKSKQKKMHNSTKIHRNIPRPGHNNSFKKTCHGADSEVLLINC